MIPFLLLTNYTIFANHKQVTIIRKSLIPNLLENSVILYVNSMVFSRHPTIESQLMENAQASIQFGFICPCRRKAYASDSVIYPKRMRKQYSIVMERLDVRRAEDYF